MERRKVMDQLLEAIYRLREGGMTAAEVTEAVARINRQFEEDLAGLQMLQEELGHVAPREPGEQQPRVSVQPPSPDGRRR